MLDEAVSLAAEASLATAPAMRRLAVAVADPVLARQVAARLAVLPGVVVSAREPELTIADRPGPGPRLVLVAGGTAAAAALRAGARGVLPPEASVSDFAVALPAIARGLVVAPPAAFVPPRRESPAPGASLTPREREVLDLLTEGASNKLIARRLGLSFHTAKAHVAMVMEKLGATSRADAVARGARAGLVLL